MLLQVGFGFCFLPQVLQSLSRRGASIILGTGNLCLGCVLVLFWLLFGLGWIVFLFCGCLVENITFGQRESNCNYFLYLLLVAYRSFFSHLCLSWLWSCCCWCWCCCWCRCNCCCCCCCFRCCCRCCFGIFHLLLLLFHETANVTQLNNKKQTLQHP